MNDSTTDKATRFLTSHRFGEALFIIGMTLLAVTMGILTLQLSLGFHWIVP